MRADSEYEAVSIFNVVYEKGLKIRAGRGWVQIFDFRKWRKIDRTFLKNFMIFANKFVVGKVLLSLEMWSKGPKLMTFQYLFCLCNKMRCILAQLFVNKVQN